jgi:hypothetical protein
MKPRAFETRFISLVALMSRQRGHVCAAALSLCVLAALLQPVHAVPVRNLVSKTPYHLRDGPVGQRCALASTSRSTANPDKVVVMGVGRSGTTLMMHLLSALDPEATFAFPEPYLTFEHTHSSDTTPPLASMFNCSVTNDPNMLQRLFWTFACATAIQITRNPSLSWPCNEGKTDGFGELCLASSLRIVKTIRLPMVSDALAQDHIIPTDARTVLIVRHPASILRSQVLLGWVPINPESGDNNKVLTEQAEKICSDTLANTRILATSRVKHRITIRHEDLKADFDETMRAVMCKLGLTYDSAKLHAQLEKQSAALPHLYPDDVLSAADAMRAVAGAKSCDRVLEEYGYKTGL